MAVMVVPKKRVCPQCFETLSYTSKDVRKTEQKQPTSYHENGKIFHQIRVTIFWHVTCPTCGKFFIAEKFERYDKA